MNTTKSKLSHVCVLGLLILINFAVFSKYLNNPYAVDDISFASDQCIYFENKKSIADFFTHLEGQHYIPLHYLTNYFLFRSFANCPVVLRTINLIIYVLGAYCFYVLLKRLGLKEINALGAVVCFSLHPLNAGNVFHATQNLTVLSGIFMTLSLIYYLKIHEEPREQFSHTAVSCLFLLIALLYLEFAVVLPIYILMIGTLIYKESFKSMLRKLWPWLLIDGVFLAVWFNTGQEKAGLIQNISSLPITFYQYIVGISKLIQWYLLKLIFPSGIVVIYNIPMDQLTLRSGQVLATMFIVGGIFLAHIRFCKNKIEKFFSLFFIVGLIPALITTFIHNYMGLVFEPHWMYFSSLGAFVVLFTQLEKHFKNFPQYFIVLLVFISVYLAVLSRAYGIHWKDNLSYGEYWLSINPRNRIALNIVADEYLRKGELNKALTYYQRILDDTSYDDYKIYNLIASIYDRLGDKESARQYCLLSISKNSENPEAYIVLGTIEGNAGNYVQARNYFLEALRYDPDNPVIIRYLAEINVLLQGLKAGKD